MLGLVRRGIIVAEVIEIHQLPTPKLKILHIISAPSIGGIETYVKDLAKVIVARGHSVHIGFLESAAVNATSQEFQRGYLSELDDMGVEYFFLGNHARRRIWHGVERARQYVAEKGIDVYHSHLTYGIVFGMRINVPRVYTHHSVDMRVGRFVFTLINRFIDQLVGVSLECTKTLSKHASRNVETIFSGVDLERFSRQTTSSRQMQGAVNCISVGRICEEKNYGLLVRAISLLPQEIRSRLAVKIVGAGSEELTNSLEKKILDIGVGDVISLAGSRSDVPALLESAQLFLMSSSSEGLPIALIEAVASGLPCAVTDVGGCREVIERCQNGIVVEPDNPQKFADAIAMIIGNAEKYSEYSANALLHAKNFSIENAASSHISMYQRLLSPTPQS
jgi:glycosyltransferase involved in cell wall biosynthesis